MVLSTRIDLVSPPNIDLLLHANLAFIVYSSRDQYNAEYAL